MLIARLIADKADWETRLDAMNDGLRHSDIAMPSEPAVWENAGRTVIELGFGGDDTPLVFNILRTHFGECDALVTRDLVAVPKLFVSDMDSTMIGQECIDELADYAGLKEKIAEITERAMQGELDFESALNERVGLLRGLDEGAIDQCLEERISPTPGAKVLTQTLRAHGCRTVLVTG